MVAPEARDARQIARAFLDELDAREPRQRNGVGNGDVGARSGVEIERDRQAGFPGHRLEIGDEIVPGRRAREGPLRRQQLDGGGALAFGRVGELDRGLERGMRNADHHRHAAGDRVDRGADEGLALVEAEIGVFLGFDAGGDHHGGTAVGDDVVDLAAQRSVVDLEIRRERGERRDDQSGPVHRDALPLGRRAASVPIPKFASLCGTPVCEL
jgi:hypothetical protein